MVKKLIVANWKMNPASQKSAKRLFEAVKKSVRKVKNTEVVVCPPFIYLSLLKGLPLGAQDVFHENEGTFTGEISPLMLKDLGVKHVIVGHSERRMYFGETDEMINKKIKATLREKLKPIFCIGENIGEDKTTVLERQMSGGLSEIAPKDFKKIVIAYEPVWAIGTGNNCSINETMSSILLIRKIISKLYGKKSASAAKIIYGGSVDSGNAGLYLREAGASGLLVGGASLDAEEFIRIIMAAQR